MHEIICPHCRKAFKIDEAGYADILQQVRDHAFDEQLQERLALAEQDKRNAVELAKLLDALGLREGKHATALAVELGLGLNEATNFGTETFWHGEALVRYLRDKRVVVN